MIPILDRVFSDDRGGATTGSAALRAERVNGRSGPPVTKFKSPLCSVEI